VQDEADQTNHGAPGITRRSLIAGAAAALLSSTSYQGQPTDLTALSIDELGRRIRSRQLSPVELTRAYLSRIEKFNPGINAYITVTADQALTQARALEAEMMRGRNRGPLHGIPIALKDNIDTAGVRTTAASAVFADRVPGEDAVVVQKLREAGAVFLGKLNMHEFAYGGTSVVTHFGPVRNPWNVEYAPGGSSGGSGAAVAARMCAAALGTDTAASVRMPAAFCGVVGVKATHGLASIRGIIPLSESHDHVGPLCRNVVDSAIMLTAMSGFDPLDPMSIDASRQNYRAQISRMSSRLRIGIPREPFFADLDPEIGAAIEKAIAVITKMSRTVTEVKLPAVDTFSVLLAEIYAYHAGHVADEQRKKLYHPLTLQRILDGAAIPSAAFIEGRRRMSIARNTIADLFKQVDLLVTPTTMAMPGKIADALANAPSEIRLIRNTVPFNSLGIPAISVPCGFTQAGLPIGLQIAGPRLGEAQMFSLAHAYEQATEWHRRQPALG
jgi:aspartyl-tRNA(Asn)/glutamyl-tRNA(Gln) amidotransferase subunit A